MTMPRLPIIPMFIAFTLQSCSDARKNYGETEITRFQFGKAGAISITYDDATINQFRKALPIMDTLGIKGTFYINTADIPGSQFPPKWIGRPLSDIIKETGNTPTNKDNLFERASALRFLDIENAIEKHNSAGSLFENDKLVESYRIVDTAFDQARNKKSYREVRPILLTGERITWPEIKTFAANGHEFGSHTISHPRLAVLNEENLLYELEKCREEIRNQVGTEHTFSAECPFGTENERVMEYAYKIHPALRNRMPEPWLEELNRGSKKQPGTAGKEYVQWQRGPLTKTPMDLMKSWVDTVLVHDNFWLVLTFHGVDGIGWEAKPSSEHSEYFRYMKAKENELWIATFKDVTKYLRQRMNAELKVEREKTGIVVNFDHSLDKNLYDLPLTLKTYVDPGWKTVVVKQSGKVIQSKPLTDDKGPYILYQAFANGQPVEISSAE